MGKLSGVVVEQLQGGLARLATGTDNHVAYIVSGLPVGAIATAVNNDGKGVVLTSLFQAEQLGINESFDANNGLNIHRQIDDFFRLAPEATLYLFNSVESTALSGFINHNKEIKGYGFNVEFDQEANNVTSTINAHQAIVNAFKSENRFIDFVVIGFDGLDDYSLDLFSLSAPNVSVCITSEDNSKKVVIGTALGGIAVRNISENLGSVDIINKPIQKRGATDYTLTDSVLDRWTQAFLSSGENIEAVDKTTLNEIIRKGYIVVAGYEGYAGYFFENSYTCIDRGSDFAFIENNRTWNKAARIIRATLLPRVKSKVKKDPITGFIANTTISFWKVLLEKAINRMVIDDEISGYEIFIDNKQIVNNTNPVKIRARIVTDGIVHEFEVALGLTNNI